MQPKVRLNNFVKIEIDSTWSYIFSSSLKSKDVHWVDFTTTRTMSTFSSGQPITWMKLTPDNKYLVTCSSRGWFYIWKLQKEISATMNLKAKQKEVL